MMKAIPRRAAAACAALLLVFSAAACRSGDTPSDGTHTTADDGYVYHIDMTAYEGAVGVNHPGFLKLVNKTHTVGSDFAPYSLSTLGKELTLYGKEVKLESTAALAAEAMVREMWAMGWREVKVTSGFRTYAYQESLFEGYTASEQAKHPGWSRAQAEAEVLTYSARPGTSEHQTGLGMDLIIADSSPALDESFAQHPCYAWLTENAWRFGFILRFPRGKEGVTGYSFEPWHYRFVGKEAAKAIHAAGLTLEEYVDR